MKEKTLSKKIVTGCSNFVMHYLFDTMFVLIVVVGVLYNVLCFGMKCEWNVTLTFALAVILATLSGIFYWLIVRSYIIKNILATHKHYYHGHLTRFSNKVESNLNNWIKENVGLDNVDTNKNLNKFTKDTLNFVGTIKPSVEKAQQEQQDEIEKRQRKVLEYTRDCLAKLDFVEEEISAICLYVKEFIITGEINTPKIKIEKKKDVKVSELKNMVWNIRLLYGGIDSNKCAHFVRIVFSEWCKYYDNNGKEQETEESTIAKTLRAKDGNLRVKLIKNK